MRRVHVPPSHGGGYGVRGNPTLPNLRFNLTDARDVPAAGKRSGKPDTNDFESQLGGERALSQGQHVGVVVFARPSGGIEAPAERATNAADFVGDDRFSVSRAPENDAALTLATRHRLRGGT